VCVVGSVVLSARQSPTLPLTTTHLILFLCLNALYVIACAAQRPHWPRV